jgi:hypothetical protein
MEVYSRLGWDVAGSGQYLVRAPEYGGLSDSCSKIGRFFEKIPGSSMMVTRRPA